MRVRTSVSFLAGILLLVTCAACPENGNGTGGEDGYEVPTLELFVTNLGAHSVVGFTLDPVGNILEPPTRVLQGDLTELNNPMDVSMTVRGEIHVVNLGDATRGPGITVYPRTANGNVAPSRSHRGASFRFGKPNSISVGGWPGLLVTNFADATTPGALLGVLEISPVPANASPSGGIFGSQTTITGPAGLALKEGKIFVADTTTDRILGWEARGNQQNDTAPDVVLAGDQTLLDRPLDLAFDEPGNLYVLNSGDASITVYPPAASGNVGPARRIKGPSTMLANPTGLAVNKQGRIYVSQANRVLVFGPGASGDEQPVQDVTDPSLSGTMGLFVRQP